MKTIIKARRTAMPRCIILTPLYAGEELPWIAPQPGDFLICADGGWACARQFGLTPQLVVGDFDSMPPEMRPDVPTLTLPTEKMIRIWSSACMKGANAGTLSLSSRGRLAGASTTRYLACNARRTAPCAANARGWWTGRIARRFLRRARIICRKCRGESCRCWRIHRRCGM